jgi:hypothetical protein
MVLLTSVFMLLLLYFLLESYFVSVYGLPYRMISEFQFGRHLRRQRFSDTVIVIIIVQMQMQMQMQMHVIVVILLIDCTVIHMNIDRNQLQVCLIFPIGNLT